MPRQWISLTDAARMLRLSYHAVLRLVLIGELEATKRDGRWRVRRSSVEHRLNRGAQP